MGIFKAPKAGSQSNELIVGRLTGVMDLKIFYKQKTRGTELKISLTKLVLLLKSLTFYHSTLTERHTACPKQSLNIHGQKHWFGPSTVCFTVCSSL